MDPLIKSDQEESSRAGLGDSPKTVYGSINEIVLIDEDIREEKINNLQSLMNLLKGYIGTGILAIPSAFKYGGLLVSMAGIFVVGIIATHCVHMLVSCSRYVGKKINKQGMDYGKLAEEVFCIGPPQLHPHARKARIFVNVFLGLTQFGFLYCIHSFLWHQIQKLVIENYAEISWAPQIYQCLIVLLLIPYLAVTNLRILSFFSGIANALMVFGLAVVLYTCFLDLPPVSSRPFVGSWSSFPLYFGIVIFAFEGIGVVIPIDNKVRTPKDFSGWFGVINLGMTIITCLVAGIGFFGYLKYGEAVKDSITSNFLNTIFYNIVNLCFVLAIFFTYGIQFYVPIEFLWSDIKPKLKTGSFMYQYGEYFLRLFFLILTFVLAAAVPHLDLMISLVGALASTAVALLFPALLDVLCSFHDGYGTLRWKLIKDIIIFLFGLLGFIAGTGTTLYQIVMAFQKSGP